MRICEEKKSVGRRQEGGREISEARDKNITIEWFLKKKKKSDPNRDLAILQHILKKKKK